MTNWESAFTHIYSLLDKANDKLRDAKRIIKYSFMWQPITEEEYPWDSDRLYLLHNEHTDVTIVVFGAGSLDMVKDFTHYKPILSPKLEQRWYDDLCKKENE